MQSREPAGDGSIKVEIAGTLADIVPVESHIARRLADSPRNDGRSPGTRSGTRSGGGPGTRWGISHRYRTGGGPGTR